MLWLAFRSDPRCSLGFFNNSASENGGAFSVSSASADIKNCTFENNYAAKTGGGVYLAYSATANITGSRFVRNRAGTVGGAVATTYSAFPSIYDSIFEENVANFGGAVSAQGYTDFNGYGDLTSLRIVNSRISRNVAKSSGGGVWIGALIGKQYQKPTVEINSVTFDGNVANGSSSPNVLYPSAGGGAIGCNLLFSSDGIVNIRLFNNSAPYFPPASNFALSSCGQMSPYICDRCSSSQSDCIYSGSVYAGECTCASPSADQMFCTPPSGFTCYGLPSSHPAACAGGGECVGPDDCLCDVTRGGLQCQLQRSELKVLPADEPFPYVNCTNGVCPNLAAAVRLIQNVTASKVRLPFLISLSEGVHNTSGPSITLPVNTNLRGLGAGASLTNGLRPTQFYSMLNLADVNWTPLVIIQDVRFFNSSSGISTSGGALLLKNVLMEDIRGKCVGSRGLFPWFPCLFSFDSLATEHFKLAVVV